MDNLDGGYDEGYKNVDSLWGTAPGSLITKYLSDNDPTGMRIVDLGAGEGKNANAFSEAGATVDALEISTAAIKNGKKIFRNNGVNWINTDVRSYTLEPSVYDAVISYGLVHCMKSVQEATELIAQSKDALKEGGTYFLVAFNNGSHDLSAHPNFDPLLLSHQWYLDQFRGWNIDVASDSILYETHPHNKIPHHHSLTRLVASK